MATRFKKFIKLLSIILAVGIFGVAFAASPDDNVTVTVKDKSGKKVPFAIVTVDGITTQTGPRGEVASFDLDNGKHNITATHPLVEKRGKDLTGKASVKLTNRKNKAKVTIKLKGKMKQDDSAPQVSDVAPDPAGSGEVVIASSRTVSFIINAEDPESGIALAEATLDNKVLGAAHEQNSTTYTWKVPAPQSGKHSITYTIWNYAGKATNHTVAFTVAPPRGDLSGTVTFNNVPVANAIINLASGIQATTDAQGKFFIRNVDAKTYNATISADGLTQKTQSMTVVEDIVTEVNVALADGVAPATPTNLSVTRTNPTTSKQALSWNAVAADRSGISYELERSTGTTVIETKKVNETTFVFDNLQPNTTYSYRVRAIDGSNNASAWTSKQEMKTQLAPTLTWSAPSAGQKLAGKATLTVEYVSHGTTNKIKDIEWKLLPSTALGKTDVNAATGTKTVEWNTVNTPNGNYTLQAIATDLEGNTVKTDVVIAVENQNLSQLTGRVTAGGAAIANARIKSDDDKTATTNAEGRYTLNGVGLGQRTITASAAGFADQSKTITVAATGNAAVDFELTDTVAPSTPAIASVNNINPTATTQEVKFSAASDASGIAEYEVEQTDGTNTAKKVTTELTATFTNLKPDTQYSYRVRAKDKAATPNYSTWSSAKDQATQKMPTLVWTTPADNDSIKDTVNLTVNYTVFTTASDKVTLSLQPDNTLIHETTPSQTSGQVTHSWDTRGIEGRKTLRALVTDGEGNSTTAEIAVDINVKNNPGVVKGTVTEAGSNAAVANMPVELKQGNTVVATAKTDANGQYQFDNVTAGTYSLLLSDEGYQDKTVNNVTVSNNQTVTADISLTSLPRISFNGTVRELAGPGRAFEKPAGISIAAGTKNIAIVDNGSDGDVHLFDAQTERHISSTTYAYGVPLFMAYDEAGMFVAHYGYSMWADFLGNNQQEGSRLAYMDVTSTPDNKVIYATVTDRIYRFIGRQLSPAIGYATESLYGPVNTIAASNKNIFAATTNKITRLSQAAPLDATASFNRDLPFIPGEIYYIPETRSIIVSEVWTNKFHVLDSRTFEVNQTFTLPTGELQGRIGVAAFADNGNIKLFITTYDQNKVYIVTSN